MLGKRVQAEGLLWGAFEKGLGQRVILDGATVYVRGIDLLNRDWNGKIARVEGVLRIASVKPAPPGASGYGDDFSYFYIEADRVERIERVDSPWLQEFRRTNKVAK